MDFSQEMSTGARFCMPICNRVINTDISEDFSLPDYNPEIRRVLYVKECLLPPAKFISGNKLDVNGVVDYTLVYISNEGKLCSAPLSAEYSFSLPLENASDFEMSEGVSVMVHSIAENSTVRVSSPRKLQIRSHLSSNVSAWGKKSCGERIEGIQDPASIQRLMKDSVCADVFCESSDVVTLEDEYILPSENCRVALADSAVFVEGCRIEGELVRISGEVVLKMLVICEQDETSECVVRRLRFDAESDLVGAQAEESLCRVSGSVTDVSMSIEEGKVMTEANLVLEICLGQNRGVSYTSDIYSTEQDAEVSVRTQMLPMILANKNFNVSQSERVPLEELNFAEGAQIVDVCGSASVQEVIAENGKFVFKGNCKYNVICSKDGEYSYCEARVPFRCESEGDGAIDSFDACVDVLNCRARADAEYLNIDAELGMACTVMGNSEAIMLQRAMFGEELAVECGKWTVCYVQNNESLWDIAKRYGVSSADIKGDPSKDRFVMIER